MNEIRNLKPADIPAAMRLCQAASWNQVPEDWNRLLELEPAGCFAIEEDGGVVATATAVCFGNRLSWIGMVLTDPNYRRRGLARRLMEHCIEYSEQRGIDWIKLDATEMGRPLYARLGFEDECGIERWGGRPLPASESSGQLAPYRPEPELDLAAFGADRMRLLDSLSRAGAVSIPGEGYAMGRPGANASTVGPCVARSAEAARQLLREMLARQTGESVFWDLLPDNGEAVRLAGEFGFERKRKLIRMVRPGRAAAAPLEHDNTLVYATSGFEYG